MLNLAPLFKSPWANSGGGRLRSCRFVCAGEHDRTLPAIFLLLLSCCCMLPNIWRCHFWSLNTDTSGWTTLSFRDLKHHLQSLMKEFLCAEDDLSLLGVSMNRVTHTAVSWHENTSLSVASCFLSVSYDNSLTHWESMGGMTITDDPTGFTGLLLISKPYNFKSR